MAKKPTVNKGRKTATSKAKTKAQPRRRTPVSDSAALSVTDGEMKDLIRTAFLRRS